MTLYRHEFAICPWCSGESGSRVDHLYGDRSFQEFGPWYCGECGKPFRGKVNAPGDVSIWKDEKDKCSWSRAMVLLRFDGKDGPVFFVIDHRHYHDGEPETDEQYQSSTQYFFEEHSCPTNWLHECAAVIQDADCDPHGFLEFVRAVDVPQDFNDSDDDNWRDLFPECFPTTIEGEARKPARLPSPSDL